MTIGVKVLKKPPRTLAEQAYLPETVKGLRLTMSRFFKNTFGPDSEKEIATVKYPEETRVYPERFRGVHRLTQRADGSPRCVACLCCSTACPAQCIHIEPGEYAADDPRAGYERYPKVFVIDELRCISCGYCVEACPCDAIRMDTGVHMPASTHRDHFLYDKETLLSLPGADGSLLTANTRPEPGDADHPGIDRDHH
ncbi:MAG: NADH-quinone oxidoreductase subunit I [Deltaproteobacteria bacterium]|nr:NADH-quinone oxidoreductase subunit I [Deltaproteobacteria bacterium]